MIHFEVLSPGLFTTLQDEGRFGFEDQGVPPSGAMDELSFAVANALVGNPANTGALEITLLGPTLRLAGDRPCHFAVTGNLAATLNGHPCAPYRCHEMQPGSVLALGRVISGARSYLAVAGGFAVAPVLGSVSTLMRAGLGGFAGRPLQKNDHLPLVNAPTAPPYQGAAARIMPQMEKRPIRIIWGPQDTHFDAAAKAGFIEQRYTLSNQSDRMGYRLQGQPIAHSKGFNIVSDAIVRGSIQIPGNGLPIVAMSDRQTTGGYPKIATVIRADLARLGQLKPGDKLQFEPVSVEKAETLWCGRQQALAQWLEKLRGGQAGI